MNGSMNYHSGLAAEGQVAAHYLGRGHRIAAHRWRGHFGGEIDLISREGKAVHFVEVKRAARHEIAVQRLSRRQMQRIGLSAEEFVAGTGEDDLEWHFDVALVDGAGRIAILEDAMTFD